MAQIINAGDNELREDVSSTAPKPTTLSVFSERGLALAVAVGLHAAILPWLLTKSPEIPPVSEPQALPVQIEFTVAAPAPVPETPTPVSEPRPDTSTTPAPLVDENASTPAPEPKPEPKPKPVEKKQPPKIKPLVRPQTKPKHEVRPVQKPNIKPSTPAQPATQPATHTSAAQPSAAAPAVTPPIANAGYLHNPAPDYPESAIERGLEGTVLLRVTVNPEGKATGVQIYQSSGTSALDDAALRTVRHWSFVPAKRGTEAVSGQVIVPVDFSLNS